MLLLVVLTVLLSNGSCINRGHRNYNGNHDSQRYSTSSGENREGKRSNRNTDSANYFYVQVNNIDLHFGGKPKDYVTDTNYIFDIGKTIEITCKQRVKGKSLSLKWRDTQGIETKATQNFMENAIRIRMKPNKDDNGLILTCHAYGPVMEHKISITLLTDLLGTEIKGYSMFLKTGQAYTTNETCYGIVHYPKTTERLDGRTDKYIVPNEKIIENFNEKLNGTTLLCTTYQNLGFQYSLATSNMFKEKSNVTTYERLTSKVNFYLEPEKKTVQKTSLKTETETKDSREPGHKTQDSQNSDIAIVGGVLGAIILFLISLLLVMWYRKMLRPANFDGAVDQVIYAEIEDLPPVVPPPRRVEAPYAKIIGTLVPKTQEQPNEENLYSSMN